MMWIYNMAEHVSKKIRLGFLFTFIVLSMLILGIAGVVFALLISMLPVFSQVSTLQMVIIGGGYGAFLFGMIGAGVYYLIREPDADDDSIKNDN